MLARWIWAPQAVGPFVPSSTNPDMRTQRGITDPSYRGANNHYLDKGRFVARRPFAVHGREIGPKPTHRDPKATDPERRARRVGVFVVGCHARKMGAERTDVDAHGGVEEIGYERTPKKACIARGGTGEVGAGTPPERKEKAALGASQGSEK